MLGGPDAIGGVGDWALRNGTLCAVVADPSHQSNIAISGGGLIDLGLCGRDDDQFLLYQELVNGRLSDPAPYHAASAEAGPDAARIVVRGGREGLAIETRYELDRERPRRLRIASRVERKPGGERLTGYAGAIANVRGLTPFNVSLRDPSLSRGYTHPTFFERGLGALGDAASRSELVIAVGAEELRPGIAYGQLLVDARVEVPGEDPVPLPRFFLADALATIGLVTARPFWLGDGLGRLQLLQMRFMDVPVGGAIVLEQEIWVGERADAASVTDLLRPDAPLLSGSVDDSRAVVHVAHSSGAPLTQIRVGDDGRFAARVPPGVPMLRVTAPGGREIEMAVKVGAAGADVGLLRVGAPALVRIPRIGPARLVFTGQDGTEAPDFHDDLRGYTLVGDEGPWRLARPEPTVHLAGTDADPTEVVVAPGRYRVLATRGPEFSLTAAEVEARPGETVTLALAAPQRVIETPGWLSSDFHVHSAPSLDNPTAPARRVAEYVAQGAEVLVAAEHDNLYDYSPLIRELGLADRLANVVGLEVTSEVRSEIAPHTMGHGNAFPIPVDPIAYRRGAVPDEGRRWRDVIADLRAIPGDRILQLNHARFGEPGIQRRAFFSHMGPAGVPFEPDRPLDEPPNTVLVERDPETGVRDLDFDAMELWNGPHRKSYERLRRDWFALLRQGERLVGTANSDSHFVASPAAAPRNYVRLTSDRIADFDSQAFVDAVRAGRLYGTSGPIVELSLEGAGIGDTFRGEAGTLRGTVHAADWVGVSELRVYVTGVPLEPLTIEPGKPFAVPLAFERDGFVTIEASGEGGADFEAVLPRHFPFAFTNPIWVDADGDGRWTPPGLGEEEPR